MRDLSSRKQRYPKYPPQDPYLHKKPGDAPQMHPGYHMPRVLQLLPLQFGRIVPLHPGLLRVTEAVVVIFSDAFSLSGPKGVKGTRRQPRTRSQLNEFESTFGPLASNKRHRSSADAGTSKARVGVGHILGGKFYRIAPSGPCPAFSASVGNLLSF